MDRHQSYQSPLANRYASQQMQAIWSPKRKFSTWRRLWLALAESQQKLGLHITDDQLQQMRSHLDDIDFEAAKKYEAELRHDVMAHIHAFGDIAPKARPIIHLGATSQFVGCNTDLILLSQSLELIANKLARVIDAFASFAAKYRDLPTLGFTHYQPAQPTTVGKRATLWTQDFVLSLQEIEHRLATLRFRGVKGATGTQTSFLDLFDGDHAKVEKLDEMVTQKMGWPVDKRFAVTGQTYSRLVDAQILNSLAIAATAVHKTCNDIRLLANRKELEEPFGKSQVGSSAMPYKRNPMLCERATSLARFVISMPANALNTAATQWFERTLDDSANRRLSLPESLLALDGTLDVMHEVASGLVVYEKTIKANLLAELPFMASERILMAAVTQGADRQAAHEVLRKHSQLAGQLVKEEAAENDLLKRLRDEPMFAKVDLDAATDPAAFIGRAPQQVDAFIEQVVKPIRDRYS